MIAIRNDLGISVARIETALPAASGSALPPIRATQDLGVEQATLLSNMVAAGRDAESFPQAIAAALKCCAKLWERTKRSCWRNWPAINLIERRRMRKSLPGECVPGATAEGAFVTIAVKPGGTGCLGALGARE